MFLVYGGDIKRELKVSCYTDDGYLTDTDDLKSQTGYVFVLNGGDVDWKSANQSIFATSSAEAEYIAVFDASKEAVWVRKFISGLGVVPTIEKPITNESGITKGARHFRAKVYYLREVIEYADVKLEKVRTDDNLADPFTKALAFPKHSEHTRNIRMFPASSLISDIVLSDIDDIVFFSGLVVISDITESKGFLVLFSDQDLGNWYTLVVLVCFNGASIFSISIPENVAGNSRNMVSVSLSLSNLMYSLEEQNPSLVSKTHLESHEIPVNEALNPAKFTDVQLSMHNVQLRKTHQDEILNTVLDTHLPLLRKSHSLEVETDDLNGFPGKSGKVSKALTFMESFDRYKKGEFRAKVKEFFSKNESSCKMKLIKGDINVGYVPLGQNLSNLLRLCLLYKFGGVYIDTDVFVLKSFSKLRNSMGAQTLDLDTKNWSRLNNAVMVFDKMHPLV
nr:alpha 1,4-glycosyltransferase domain-containing protein [Tanacetum cinerariifolium]